MHYHDLMLYCCTGSVMSLVSGITFGGLLAYGAYRTSANPKDFIFLLGKETGLLCRLLYPLPWFNYRMARNFRGLKFSLFSRINHEPRKLYP